VTPDSHTRQENSAPIDLTAEEYHCIICALAGNFPERFGPIRMNLLRKLTKAERAIEEGGRLAS
jgi:hypothetical protein